MIGATKGLDYLFVQVEMMELQHATKLTSNIRETGKFKSNCAGELV